MQLEDEIVALKARLERLEATVQQLEEDKLTVATPVPRDPYDREQLRAWLKAQGVTSDPTPPELTAAKRWQALSKEDKQAIRDELDNLPPDPMVSDIVIANRR